MIMRKSSSENFCKFKNDLEILKKMFESSTRKLGVKGLTSVLNEAEFMTGASAIKMVMVS